MTIHQKIRQIRDYKDLSQLYMASKLKISQSKYNKLETGKSKIYIECFYEISKILSISMDDLYTQPLESILKQNLAKSNNKIVDVNEQVNKQNIHAIELLELLDQQVIIINRLLNLKGNI